MLVTIISFIFIFGLLVFVHELGHFIAAKKFGVAVREFSVGMGPKLLSHFYRGTTYNLRMFPFGGFIRMAGKNDEQSEELSPGTLVFLKLNAANQVAEIFLNKKDLLSGAVFVPLTIEKVSLGKKKWIQGRTDFQTTKRYELAKNAQVISNKRSRYQIAPHNAQVENIAVLKRFVINFAGIFINIVFAIILFTLLAFLQGGVATSNNSTNKIGIVQHNSVASKVNLKPNDRIIEVNGQKEVNGNKLVQAIQARPDKTTNLVIQSPNGHSHNVKVKPSSEVINGKKLGIIGIQLKPQIDDSFWAKITAGFTQTFSFIGQIMQSLFLMITGHFNLNSLGGPVAMYASTSQAERFGFLGILTLLALFSVNLAIANLLPIPGLDGGKIAFNIVEIIRRKPLSEKVEMGITIVGIALLVSLMIVVTGNDIMRYLMK